MTHIRTTAKTLNRAIANQVMQIEGVQKITKEHVAGLGYVLFGKTHSGQIHAQAVTQVRGNVIISVY